MKKVTDYEIEKYRLTNAENGVNHFPFELELQYIERMERGDEEGMAAALDAIMHGEVKGGIMSTSPVKQAEYTAVIWVTMAVRAAMRGGVDAYIAYDINDLYLQKISETESPEEYDLLREEAVARLLKEIKIAKGGVSPSLHTSRAKSYILKNLYNPFTARMVAENVGVSPNYLSAIFRQNEGVTIKEYTILKRVESAKNLLAFTDIPIAQIAEYLCFSSQSHFGAAFRRVVGATPDAYRRTNRQGIT